MPLKPGTRLGPYEILAPLGAGGMGEVYRARDSRLARDVAVKVLPERLASQPEALARFEREARAVAALSHPNILAIYDFGFEGEVIYSVTELLEGATLRARLAGGVIEPAQTAELGAALAEGLAAAHAKGITHRDLKPENIFLTTDGRVKLLDFGLARMETPSDSSQETVTDLHTPAGTVMGTLGYMSPEQVRCEAVTPASDLFSLGCVLYEMLYGRRPFQRPTAAESVAAILMQEAALPADPARPLLAEMARLVRSCLEKEAPRRVGARELAQALKNLQTPAAAAAIDSLAVLPFSTSGGPDSEYLGEGIAESLINSFSKIPSLRVVPRSRVFRYKGRDAEPQAVGRELNARLVLSGRVVERGDRLSVQVELVDAAEDKQIWGERFLRKTTDIFEVEQEIASRIAATLRLQLSGQEKQELARRYTDDSEAYQLYLRGRHHWAKRTPDGLQRALECFGQAIDRDPSYALAYAGTADVYAVLAFYGTMTPREAARRLKAAALRAVELDDQLAEAHSSLAEARFFCDWDWPAAEAGFRRAIDLNPAHALGHDIFGLCLAGAGRFEDAVAEIRRAIEMDPLSLVISHHASWVYFLARRDEEMVREAQWTIDIDPNFGLGYLWLGLAYTMQGKPEAIGATEKARQLGPTPAVLGRLAHCYATFGREQQARQLLEELESLSGTCYVEPYELAAVFLALGDPAEAWKRLDQACEDRSPFLAMMIRGDRRLDGLRGEARFEEILRRVWGL